MPRYYFNVYDGVSSPDQDGTELADLAGAKIAALRLMGQLLNDDPDSFWNNHQWRLDVTNDAGLTLFTLMFAAVESAAISR